jgi:hypothetical protein
MLKTVGDGMIDNAGYLAGTATVVLGLNAEVWGIIGVIVGILFMGLTFATNLYFKCKAAK